MPTLAKSPLARSSTTGTTVIVPSDDPVPATAKRK